SSSSPATVNHEGTQIAKRLEPISVQEVLRASSALRDVVVVGPVDGATRHGRSSRVGDAVSCDHRSNDSPRDASESLTRYRSGFDQNCCLSSTSVRAPP